jgi:hypothetical protein
MARKSGRKGKKGMFKAYTKVGQARSRHIAISRPLVNRRSSRG